MKTIFRSILATLALAVALASALTSALALAGCGGGGPASGDLRTLDLEAAIDNPRPFDLTDIATEIDFIPLDDSTPDALIAGIINMSESRRHYYIMESSQRPVKAFDKQGGYVGTRGSIGRGPGEYLNVSNLVADPDTDNVYVLSQRQTITAFDADGRLFATNDSLDGSGSMGRIVWFDDRLIHMSEPPLVFFAAGTTPPSPAADSMTAIVNIFTRDLLHDGTITSRAKGSPWALSNIDGVFIAANSSNILSDNGNALLVKEGLSDTVFHYLPGGVLRPAMQLRLGRYLPPAEAYMTDPAIDWDRLYTVSSIFDTGERTIIRVHRGFNGGHSFLVFDAGESGGGFSATGPDGAARLFLGGVKFNPLYTRDGRLTGCMQALDIVDNRDAITHPGLAELAATLREESNPVIVVAKLK